jgi:hypothetical protein
MCSATGYPVAEWPAYTGREIGYPAIVPSLAVTGCSSKDGRPFNFVLFRPRKSAINLEVKLPRSDDVDHKIEEAGIESLDYDMRWGNSRLSLHKDDITKNQPPLKELMTAAYQGRSA